MPEAMLVPARFDITDPDAVHAAIVETRPTVVVHLAAIAVPAEATRDPDIAWRVNLGGTISLARAITATVPECTLLFVSTADAYGASFAPGLSIDESAPLAPLNTYGATKAAADLAVGAMAAEGLRAIRLRPFNHTGPGQSESFAVPAFARQIARIEAGQQPPILEVGALDTVRDFLDVRDVCAAYSMAIEQAATLPPRCIINLASGQGRRIGDLLDDMLCVAQVKAEIRTDPTRLRASEIRAATGTSSRARELLNWSPHIPWEQTISDVLADWRVRIREG